MDRIHSKYNRFISFIFIFFFYLMVIGCAGPVIQIPSGQSVSQMQKQEKKSELQDQFLGQMGQATLGYKDYAVGPEDLLEIRFYGQNELGNELGGEVRVSGNGEVTLPLVGSVQVAELSPQKIENRLVELYKEKRFIKNPQIRVSVKEYRHQRVVVTGAVTNPGSYEVIGPRTLLEMLGKAGGLNEKAGNVVHIVRHQSYSEINKAVKRGSQSPQPFAPDSETTVVDLNRLMTKRAMELNVLIKSGDVIYVPFANNAYVLGAVNKPGSVLLKDNLTVIQAVAMAGGINTVLASGEISILRLDDKGERIKIPVNINQVTKGENVDIPLKENDTVYVQESGIKKFLYNFRMLNPIPVSAAPAF